MRIIIVDDEPEIVEDLKETISVYDGFEIAGTYINPLAALADIANTKPDCAFLDIEMPGMSGIDLAERLLTINPDMDIVFITAFNHYATQAFEVNAIDYVLKPVHPVRFEKTVERLTKNKGLVSPSAYSEVRLHTLGPFDVMLDGKPIKWNRSKAKELLAYLLHFEGHKKAKYAICENLWPEYEPRKALAHLQTAMCSVRKSLGAVGREDIRIEFQDESYVLRLGHVTWDAREFDTLYECAKSRADTRSVKQAVSLYHGDYMGGEDWGWAHLTSESLARKYEELLKILATASFDNACYFETVETILNLSERQPVDVKTQLLLAEAAYAAGGKAGLRKQVTQLQRICRQAYDAELEPEIIQYCAHKGLNI